jgi:tRNA-uridine 2-sulfurtransferase
MSKDKNSKTTVVVGMSGGVDSSVSALILKQQGYRVIGMFMKNWEEKDESAECTSAQDYRDVERVCQQLDIPYYSIEFIQEYWDRVFKDFLKEYRAGRTPNPDILCNREIKFNVFLQKALELGADYLATGHYARCGIEEDGFSLLKGLDAGKDQSYFLYTLKEETLSKVLFPIGGMEKSQVRHLAREHDLATHAKKDSTGICFIGERDFREFLSQYIAAQPGELRLLSGNTVGTHQGCAYYTLGQRRGLGLGGEGEAWYVVAKDVEQNIVYVERGERHPALYSDYLLASEPSWVRKSTQLQMPYRCQAKVRYRQKDQACSVTLVDDGRLRVDFDVPQRAMTPGQSVVFYQGEICLGGAVIDSVGPSYFEQGKELSIIGAEINPDTGESQG